MSKLLKQIAELQKNMAVKSGHLDEETAERKRIETLKKAGVAITKDVMDTATNGEGAEYVPVENNDGDLVNIMRDRNTLLDALGDGLISSADLKQNQVINIAGEVEEGSVNAERTAGSLYDFNPEYSITTGKVIANSNIIDVRTGVSAQLKKYSAIDIVNMIYERVGDAVAKAAISGIVNGDTRTGASSGNVNSFNADPVTVAPKGARQAYLNYDNGIRKSVLESATATDIVDFSGTLSVTNLNAMVRQVQSTQRSDYIRITDPETAAQLEVVNEIIDSSVIGRASTLTDGAVTSLFGSDVIPVSSDILRDSTADGKQDGNTPANNTQGAIYYVKRNVIQHGFTGGLETKIEVVPGRGDLVVAAISFGFANINRAVANVPPRIVAGVNINR